MAQKVHVVLVDDLDGGAADETVSFGLDGANYIIDLSSDNSKVLREFLARYITTGRRQRAAGGRPAGRQAGTARANAGSDREQNKAIRDWAVRNGHKVSSRGRISQDIVDLYNAQAGR
ncbi:MAG: Lsr2 family protein [Longispora sp.]|nr:Lsr2 family protein [Longispora sp. (in: high G+C Gram-positive bacteria)]